MIRGAENSEVESPSILNFSFNKMHPRCDESPDVR